jgi:hypothetical protein
MSKTQGNIVNPDEYIEKSAEVRMYPRVPVRTSREETGSEIRDRAVFDRLFVRSSMSGGEPDHSVCASLQTIRKVGETFRV